jgi:hypothetical protein
MTTTDLLTFFLPGKDAGTAWTFSSPGATASREAWVYFPGGTDLSRFTSREIASEEQFNQLLAEIRTAVRERGGILAEARVHNEIIKVNLSGAEMDGYVFPRRVFRLRIAGDPRFESIAESMDLMAGDHLVIPISAAAQGKLEAFEAVCDGFSADVRSTLFNVIRRPSLEWRINRIEQILSQPPATPAEWEKSRLRNLGNQTFLEKFSHWFMWRIPVGPVAAGLLLAALAIAGANRLTGSDTKPAEQQNNPNTEGVPNTPSQTSEDPNTKNPEEPSREEEETNTDVQTSLKELFQALENPNNTAIETLNKNYFKGYDARAFENGSPVVWGITKLEALRLRLIQKADPNFLSDDARSPFKKTLENPSTGNILKSDTKALALLAWSACQRYQRPVLMANDKDQKPFPFADGDCDTINPENAIPGLRDLTQWVNDQSSLSMKTSK